MNLKIREMRIQDLATIVELERQIFIDAWSEESFVSEIVSNDYSFPLVMEVNGQIVGYAVIWRYADEMHIANFAIHPEFRQRGLGKQFMRYVLKEFGDARFAFLEVRRTNEAAIRLYQSFGFRTMQIRKKYYRDGEDALVMVKDLRNNKY
ncbi:ribosomal protein S18-alanine N-acetyltransferase [Calditrichota bacterium GD2]